MDRLARWPVIQSLYADLLSPRCTARLALPTRDQLGEGPHWDRLAGELLRVDITGGLVHGAGARADGAWTLELGGEVSAAVARACGGRVRDRAPPPARAARSRRGAVAPCWRSPSTPPRQPLQRLRSATRRAASGPARCRSVRHAGRRPRSTGWSPAARSSAVIAGTTISNGLGWSPAGERMFFIDSTTQRIDAFDFDAGHGRDRRTPHLGRDRPRRRPPGRHRGRRRGRHLGLPLRRRRAAPLRPRRHARRGRRRCRSRTRPARSSAARPSTRSTSRARATASRPSSSPRAARRRDLRDRRRRPRCAGASL